MASQSVCNILYVLYRGRRDLPQKAFSRSLTPFVRITPRKGGVEPFGRGPGRAGRGRCRHSPRKKDESGRKVARVFAFRATHQDAGISSLGRNLIKGRTPNGRGYQAFRGETAAWRPGRRQQRWHTPPHTALPLLTGWVRERRGKEAIRLSFWTGNNPPNPATTSRRRGRPKPGNEPGGEGGIRRDSFLAPPHTPPETAPDMAKAD